MVRHWVDVLAEKAGLAWSWSEAGRSDPLGAWPRQPQRPLRLSVLRYWVGKQLLERQV